MAGAGYWPWRNVAVTVIQWRNGVANNQWPGGNDYCIVAGQQLAGLAVAVAAQPGCMA
jgi:hypothetical protein